MTELRPVILCGGSGTRLWPLSRRDYPKQFLSLIGDRSLFESTLERLRLLDCADPIIVCGEPHRFAVRRQLDRCGFNDAVILVEPAPLNTAAAIALAAAYIGDADTILLVMPSDHHVGEPSGFANAVNSAVSSAAAGKLVTFGVVPTFPSTAYGYLRINPAATTHNAYLVDQFVEKPNASRAVEFVESGDFWWNSGIFLYRADTFISELAKYRRDIVEACFAAVASAKTDLSFLRPDSTAYVLTGAAESIDYALMERSSNVVTVPLDCEWSDLGSFDAIGRVLPADSAGNTLVGDTHLVDTQDSVVISRNRLVSVIGLSSIVVAETSDAVLVADRSSAQEVAKVVAQLTAAGREETLRHRKVFRPWGSYEVLSVGEGFQVKRIRVLPEQALSLQSHSRRSEHWVVVSGSVLVVRGDDSYQLQQNESTYIPVGSVHSLANTQDVVAEIVEVQVGDYLGEDDIERYEDRYGR